MTHAELCASLSPERLGFLRSIRQTPGDDTIRLAYADWLEENGQGDLDRATGEFIRVSCRLGGVPNFMAPAGYKWLDANWPRLVPSVLKLHGGFDDTHKATNPRIWLKAEKRTRPRRFLEDSGIPWVRDGRTVCFGGYRRHGELAAPIFFVFNFWKGFLEDGRSWGTRGEAKNALQLDQPINYV